MQNSELIKKAVREFYEAHGAEFSATRRGAWAVMQLIRDALGSVSDGATLIDVGAGNARLAREIPVGVRYIAIEPSSALRAEAERYLATRPNVEVRVGAFPRLPAREHSADVVACLAVLHHLAPDERQLAIEELWRIIKPGGRIVLTVWNLRSTKFFRWKTWLASWLRLALVQGGGSGDVWIPWSAGESTVQRYVHCFTLAELRRLFADSHWKIERCEPWGRSDPSSTLHAGNLVIVAQKIPLH